MNFTHRLTAIRKNNPKGNQCAYSVQRTHLLSRKKKYRKYQHTENKQVTNDSHSMASKTTLFSPGNTSQFFYNHVFCT